MAGPSIAVRVIGDTSALGASFDDTSSKASAAGQRIHDAFGSVLNTLNSTGVLGPFGTALATVNDGIGQIVDSAKKIGPALLAAGGTIAAVGGSLTALGSKDKASQQQLQASIAATGASYGDYKTQIDDAVTHQEKFGDTADETTGALSTLTQATHSPTAALGLLSEATDLAAAKHEDLNTAAAAIGKTYNGNTRLLAQYGVPLATVKKGTTDTAAATLVHQKNLAALAKVLSGQAAAGADTFSGKLDAMKAKITDQVSEFGQKYGPAITAAGAAVAGLGAAVEIASSATKIWTGIQEAFDAVMDANPLILIALAVLALIAAIVLAYTHFSAFRDLVKDAGKVIGDIFDGIKTAAEDVFHWIENNWPLLVGIIFGPFGLAIAIIVTHWDAFKQYLGDVVTWVTGIFEHGWDAVWSYFQDAINDIQNIWSTFWTWFTGLPSAIAAEALLMWHWISDEFNRVIGLVGQIWQGLWAWFVGIPGAVSGVASNMWHWISDAFSTATGDIGTIWQGLWSWFTGLPGGIAKAAVGMWDGIAGAFKSALNTLIDAWNSLSFTLPSFSIGPVSFGGETIGVPKIPHLALGGIVTGPTLAVIGESGPEAVVPLDGKHSTGPAVVIENANFHDGADVDLFLKKVALAALAGVL